MGVVQQMAITIRIGAKGGHYQSESFVCLSVISKACVDNRADAVDRLLIQFSKLQQGQEGVGWSAGTGGRLAKVRTFS